MRAGRRRSGRAGPLLAAFAALAFASHVLAQEVQPAPLLTLDQDRFFLESDFGRAAAERERTATAALEQENKRIEAELVAEEQALTEQRKTLSAAEFAARAEAFDQKVERIRSEQDSKARALTDAREADRQEFLKAAVPVLGKLLTERGGTAILDKNLVIVSLSAIDITTEAIVAVNEALAAEPLQP